MVSKQKILLLALLFITLFTACGEKEKSAEIPARPVKIIHIGGPEEVLQRSFPGKVEASEKADLAFLVPGKIIEFPVKEGEKVEKDQLIAALDPKDYEIAVQEAKTKEEYAKAQLDRKQALIEKGFVSKSEYEAQVTSYNVAKANLDTAEQNLIYTRLKAPFVGEVSAKYVQNFQTIKVNEPIVRLHNRDNLDIIVQIPESLAIHSKSRKDTQIEVEFDSAPGRMFPTSVKEISSKPDPDTQSYKLTLTMIAPKDLNVLPGMTASVFVKITIPSQGKTQKYVIPTAAVFADDNKKSYVWVFNPSTGEIRKQPVKLGQLENDTVEVIEGISTGMDIVAAGAKFLTEGMKVRPLELTSE
jgi:RND family efflux transporter MFP subunit